MSIKMKTHADIRRNFGDELPFILRIALTEVLTIYITAPQESQKFLHPGAKLTRLGINLNDFLGETIRVYEFQ